MIRTDDLRRRGLDGAYGYGSKNSANGASQARNQISVRLAKGFRRDASPSKPTAFGTNVTTSGQNYTTISTAMDGQALQTEWDAESQRSASRIIRQTTTFDVVR